MDSPVFDPLRGSTADRIGSNFNFATTNAHDTHMAELASLKQPLSGDNRDTVLAIVRFPHDDVWARSCDGNSWPDVLIRMNYDKLMCLGSSKIRDMFTPRAQARFRRRLGPDPLPPGINYVLDFTPPSEGPELADLTAALWLPRMVKLWFLAGQYLPEAVLGAGPTHARDIPERPLADKAVGAILALGHDDVCKNLGCFEDMAHWRAKDGLPGIVDENPPFGFDHIPPFRRKVEDYCPIRHRVAIVRLLRAINGDSLLLNSATRMWTVAQVAISLEVPQVVVDPVAQWLVAPPNTKFIEICPEKAFQLAYALKIPSVLIAAFRILVNEFAIDYAAEKPSPHRPALTWAQRRRDDYGDYPSDPIEYASRAFAERMTAKLALLQSDQVFDRLSTRIPEWDMLRYLGTLIAPLPPCPLQNIYARLTEGLLAAFHAYVNTCLNDVDHLSGQIADLVDAQRKHYVPDMDRKSLKFIYEKLTPTQRALTPFFWDRLRVPDRVSELSAYTHQRRPLNAWTTNFNHALETAITNNVIRPDRFHSSLSLLPLHKPIEFSLPQFHCSLRSARQLFASMTLNAGYPRNFDSAISGIPFFLSDHLLLSALDETELNYLPIWADGLDDGSGGVFQSVIPPAEMGPCEPGPGYRTGFTAAGTETDNSTVGGCGGAPSTVGGAASEFGMLSLGDGTSVDVQQGSGIGTGRRMVEGGGREDEFTDTDGVSVDYGEARFVVPAGHQAQGQAIEEYVEEGSVGGSVEDGMEESDEEVDFGSDDGSSTLDGFEEVDAAEARRG